MKKTLVIVEDINRYFFSKYKKYIDEDYDVLQAYKGRYFLFPKRIRRKIPSFFYERIGILGNWKNKLASYDKIIIFDSAYSNQIGRILEKKIFEKGKYFFYWNKMDRDSNMVKNQMHFLEKYGLKIYSYNKTDCDRYNVSFNSTVFEPFKDIETNKKDVKYDVIFSGEAKGKRALELDEICKGLKEHNVSMWIDVFTFQPEFEQKNIKNFNIHSGKITYKEYLQMIKSGKAILDADVYKEEACSLRALEALYYDKKYITNNPNIINEPFYKKENILYIKGGEDTNKVKEFLNLEYTKNSEELKAYYSIKEWSQRFTL